MSGRIRSIKPEWLEDELMVMATPEARVLSVALLLLADDHGNGRFVVPVLAATVFPGNPSVFTKAANELVTLRYIQIYQLDGQKYFAVRNWIKHQKVDKPGKPRVPRPLDTGVEKVPGGLAKFLGSLATDPDPDPDHDHDHDHEQGSTTIITKKRKTKPKTPAAPSAAPPGYVEAVALWFAAYEKRYKAKPTWGAVYGKQLQAVMRKAPIDELRELIPAFFAWMRPEVIKAGHSLSTGYASFAMKLDELRADLLDPTRRAFAAQVQAREKLSDQIATDDDQVNRINALMAREAELEQHDTERRALEQAHTTPANKALGENSAALRRGEHEARRPDHAVLVQGASPVRDRGGGLSSTGSLLRGGQAPKCGPGQNRDARPPRAGSVPVDAAHDREPEKTL